jgi:hypothetical protein
VLVVDPQQEENTYSREDPLLFGGVAAASRPSTTNCKRLPMVGAACSPSSVAKSLAAPAAAEENTYSREDPLLFGGVAAEEGYTPGKSSGASLLAASPVSSRPSTTNCKRLPMVGAACSPSSVAKSLALAGRDDDLPVIKAPSQRGRISHGSSDREPRDGVDGRRDQHPRSRQGRVRQTARGFRWSERHARQAR